MRTQKLALIVAALGIILAVYLWAPLHTAWWYVTDDYRWPTLLGPDKRITFSEFLVNCNPPDWPLGSKVNRPTYYFSTSLMMYLFGDKYQLWYITRIAIIAFSLASLGYVLTRLCNAIWASVAVILIGTHGLWSDALIRLQSEVFSFLGFALVGLLSFLVLTPQFEKYSRSIRYLLQFCLTLAALYLTGSKENITVLMIGLTLGVVLMALFGDYPRLSRLIVPFSIALVWGLIIAWFVCRSVLASGSDIYGNTLLPKSLVGVFADAIAQNYWGAGAFLATLLISTGLWFRHRNSTQNSRPPMALSLIAQACVIGYGGFLLYFYHGSIPPNSRYEFPYAFVPFTGLLIFGIWLSGLSSASSYRLFLAFLANGLAIAYGVTTFTGKQLNANRTIAERYSHSTHNFQQRLETLFKLARENPDRPILFRSHGLNDAEPLASVDLFLRANGLSNPIYLEIIGYSEKTTTTPSELNLYRITSHFITSGRFRPESTLAKSAQPIIANFSNPDLSNGAVGNFWPVW